MALWKKVSLLTFYWHKGCIAHNLQLIVKYMILYCKFHIASWFSQNASTNFCLILVSVAILRL